MLRSDVTDKRNVVTGNALNSDTSINVRRANRLSSEFVVRETLEGRGSRGCANKRYKIVVLNVD